MCKLLFLTNTKSLSIEDNLESILKVMSVGNKDGIGLFSENGYLKALSVDDVFISDDTREGFDFLSFSETIGEGYCLGHSLAVHSRTSTNYLGLDYAHPFKVNKSLFAHNGVVDIPEHNYPVETKNDSEYLAHHFENNSFKALESVSGYYAFIHFNYDENVWTIGRDNQATLYCGLIEENNSLIFSTLKTDIFEIAKILDVSLKFVKEVKDYSFIQFKDSEIIKKGKLPSKKIERKKDALFEKSIGVNRLSVVGDKKELKLSRVELFDQGYEDGYEDGLEGYRGHSSIQFPDSPDYCEGYEQGYEAAFDDSINDRRNYVR